MVPSVPITPMRPLPLAAAAALEPGSMTPSTGRPGKCLLSDGRATEAEVLQATTSILIPLETRNPAVWSAYLLIVVAERVP